MLKNTLHMLHLTIPKDVWDPGTFCTYMVSLLVHTPNPHLLTL